MDHLVGHIFIHTRCSVSRGILLAWLERNLDLRNVDLYFFIYNYQVIIYKPSNYWEGLLSDVSLRDASSWGEWGASQIHPTQWLKRCQNYVPLWRQALCQCRDLREAISYVSSGLRIQHGRSPGNILDRDRRVPPGIRIVLTQIFLIIRCILWVTRVRYPFLARIANCQVILLQDFLSYPLNALSMPSDPVPIIRQL